jgi:hypothetical protein
LHQRLLLIGPECYAVLKARKPRKNIHGAQHMLRNVVCTAILKQVPAHDDTVALSIGCNHHIAEFIE